ncbi:MAG: sulfatase [bacterium]|nr:sulfatase [bacterium]
MRGLDAAWRIGAVALLFGLIPFFPDVRSAEAGEDPPHRVAATHAERLNVLLIVIDTLRYDHMGCYGYDRRTTPNMDRLAARSLVFDNAYAQSPWTKTSVATLLTGLYPYRHGVFSEGGEESVLSQSALSLAEILRDNGYRTVGISGNPHVSRRSGLGQGFDSFSSISKWPEENNTREVAEATLQSLEGLDPGRGSFLYVHFLDPHDPWASPGECGAFLDGLSTRKPAVRAGNAYVLSGEHEIEEELPTGKMPRAHELGDEELEYLFGLYDCEISLVDQEIGRILEYLKEKKWSERTLVVICSDHGEEFLEHGMLRHGYQLFGEAVRVPLILHLPGAEVAGRRSEPVELVDIAPTVLSLLGFSEETAELDGLALPGVPGLSRNSSRAGSERASTAFGVTRFRKQNQAYVVSGDTKLIWDFQAGEGRLYDLRVDRPEREPAEAVESPLGRKLLQMLEGWIAQGLATALVRDGKAPEMDEETKQRLRALGYVEEAPERPR